MPLKPQVLLTPAGSERGGSDDDTSEFLDTEEIYAASKEASISEEAAEAQKLAAKKLAKQLKSAEKKLTLDDIEEYHQRISAGSSRSGSTTSEDDGGPRSPISPKSSKRGVLEVALEKAKLDHKETSSEEDEPKTPKSSTRSEKDSKEKDLECIIEEERSKSVVKPDRKLGMKFLNLELNSHHNISW